MTTDYYKYLEKVLEPYSIAEHHRVPMALELSRFILIEVEKAKGERVDMDMLWYSEPRVKELLEQQKKEITETIPEDYEIKISKNLRELISELGIKTK